MIATEGQPFHDPEADEALFSTLREELDTVARRGARARPGRERPRVRARDGEPAARADRGGGRDAGRGARAAAGPDRRRPPDHRRRRRHGALGEVRRGRRHRPDHHLQLGPLPDGRPRLALRPAAVRRRERDRRRHGPRGAAGRRRHARARGRLRHRSVPPDGRLPRRAPPHRLQRRAELPDRRPVRRHVPPEPRGDRDGLRARGRHDPARAREGPADRAVRVHRRGGSGDGRGGRGRARAAHGAHDRRLDRRRDGEDARRLRAARSRRCTTPPRRSTPT